MTGLGNEQPDGRVRVWASAGLAVAALGLLVLGLYWPLLALGHAVTAS